MQAIEKSQTQQVAEQLVELCRKGEFMKAVNTLYAPHIVSVEAQEMPDMPGVPKMPRETRGLDGVRGKNQWFESEHTIHSCTVQGPYCSLEKFAVIFKLDVTWKKMNKRSQMEEVAIYTVADGRIVREEFLSQGCSGGNG